MLPDGQRRDLLSAALAGIVNVYLDRVLPVDREVPERAAACRAQAHRCGRALDLGDALIDGTARASASVGCEPETSPIVSGLDVRIVNPWEPR